LLDNIYDVRIPTGSTSTHSIPGCTDPEGDVCRVEEVSTPPFGSLDPGSMLYTFNPVIGNEGSYRVSFAVSDGLNSTPYSFLLTVETSAPPAN
jgi:hypothetical protein